MRVAQKLLDTAIDLGKVSASKWVLLQTGIDNLAARKLYESNGWVPESDQFYRFDL